MCDDKCKYIDFTNIINFQIYLLFLDAGFLQDKAREKGPINVYIFQQPIALSKTGRFQNTQTDERKGTKDYITVILVYRIASWFETLAITRIGQFFVIEFVPSAALS